MARTRTSQAASTAEQNAEFFARETYGAYAAKLDSHAAIREALNREVDGLGHTLDVGNGGVFGYDPSLVESIVAVDLFFDESAADGFPENVTARKGDALALEEEAGAYDAVLETFLYHHLTGEHPAEMISNTRQALAQARRALKPGGRLIVAESCVPRWFYAVEKAAFRTVRMLARARLLGGHPATLQLPFEDLVGLVEEQFEVERTYRIPLGRWVTQFGRRWPTALTPVRAHVIVARKAAG